MNFIQSVVQSIRNQIKKELERALRDIVYENITPKAANALYAYTSQNLEWQLQYNALKTSAIYVERNLRHARALSSKLDVLEHALQFSNGQNGLFLEFGVFKGESINFIAQRTKHVIHGFDSFEGLPEAWRPGFDKSMFRVTDKSQLNFEPNIEIHKGLFEDTIPDFISNRLPKNISFLHIDCDLYSSTKTIFSHLGNLISVGTVIVFDEYFNYPGWRHHEFKAFQEYIKHRNLKYEYIAFNRHGEQVAVIITQIT